MHIKNFNKNAVCQVLDDNTVITIISVANNY